LRRDYVFAFLFVNTRILFHARMIYASYYCPSLNMGPTIVLCTFFPLHCYWFYGTLSKIQGREFFCGQLILKEAALVGFLEGVSYVS
jgi:hypothetical protein